MSASNESEEYENLSMKHYFVQADGPTEAARFAATSLYDAVEQNDIFGLHAWRDLHTSAEWNQLFQDPQRPAVNRGTIGHWAIWFRHWDLLAFWLARGGQTDIPGRGAGGWMVGLTLRQYARKLDDEAGHSAFEHVQLVENILSRRPLPGRLIRPRVSWGVNPSADSEELLNIVEANDLSNLSDALLALGAAHLRSRILTPTLDNEYGNGGTLAHWAVWHRHWQFLGRLVAAGAADLTEVKGIGRGWMSGRSVTEYVRHLDQMTSHSWYNLETSFTNAAATQLSSPLEPHPATPPPSTPPPPTAPIISHPSSISPDVPAHPPILLKIRKLSGAEFSIHIDPFATIATLKLKIEEHESIPPSQQRIIFVGRELSPETTLSQAGMTNESFVHLVLALR